MMDEKFQLSASAQLIRQIGAMKRTIIAARQGELIKNLWMLLKTQEGEKVRASRWYRSVGRRLNGNIPNLVG